METLSSWWFVESLSCLQIRNAKYCLTATAGKNCVSSNYAIVFHILRTQWIICGGFALLVFRKWNFSSHFPHMDLYLTGMKRIPVVLYQCLTICFRIERTETHSFLHLTDCRMKIRFYFWMKIRFYFWESWIRIEMCCQFVDTSPSYWRCRKRWSRTKKKMNKSTRKLG